MRAMFLFGLNCEIWMYGIGSYDSDEGVLENPHVRKLNEQFILGFLNQSKAVLC
jgi:hypothetical protein